jgi:DNA-binding HxlR family transcriptional regulator
MALLMNRKWTLSVICALEADTKRYSEIHKMVPDMTQRVLTNTLRNLERSGILHRTVYPTIPPKVEYKLTPLGLALHKATEPITEWAENNLSEIKRAQTAYDKAAKQ